MKYPSYLRILSGILLVAFLSVIVIPSIMSYLTCEVPGDEIICEAIDKNSKLGIQTNSYDRGILTIGKMPYVCKTPKMLLLYKYRVSDVGYIPFWYKSAKKLDSIFLYTPMAHKPTLREKLGI